MTWLIGGYAIVFGVLLIALAVRLRMFGKRIDVVSGQPLQTGAPART